MKTLINLVQKPTSTSFTMFAKADLSKLRENKEVTVSYNFVTKTRVSVSISIGQLRNGINFELPNYKQVSKTEYCYLSGEHTTSNYFVKSKKQNFDVFKEYVKELVAMTITEYFNVTDINVLTINLEDSGF
tara:strand:+ start:67 stop:459 length:393 start_codon:yes stop_codon:yes gene_type:complete